MFFFLVGNFLQMIPWQFRFAIFREGLGDLGPFLYLRHGIACLKMPRTKINQKPFDDDFCMNKINFVLQGFEGL